jgi:SAM-dependent methyltransferase
VLTDLDPLRDSYDRLASEYSSRIYDELQHKPFDRDLLDRFAEACRGRGRVCDLGCGPGHVARYLGDRGLDVCGMDLSAGMVEQARALNPDLRFEVGDMRALPVEDSAWAGATAFYSLIHIPPAELAATLRELHRVLRNNGHLLVAFHLGEEQLLHLDEMWGVQVSADFFFYDVPLVSRLLVEAGFQIVEALERDPYPDVEHPSRRGYLLARR